MRTSSLYQTKVGVGVEVGVKQQLQCGQTGTLTSLQEEPDVVCVVDLHSVAAGQSVQQRCLPYKVEEG